jgi:hypothetical protein
LSAKQSRKNHIYKLIINEIAENIKYLSDDDCHLWQFVGLDGSDKPK